jgi:hypothetical protein
VHDSADLGGAMDALGLRPALAVEGAELPRIGRRIDGADVVFLANPLPDAVTVTLRQATASPLVAWDPVVLRRTPLGRVVGDPTAVRLTLPALGSVVLVPGGTVDEALAGQVADVALDGTWELTLPEVGSWSMRGDPRPWTALGPEAAAFAGTGTYTTEVDLADVGERNVLLVAADIGDIARVRVNGTDCGVLWTEPFTLDVTAAVREGRNTVEIGVANAWMNRLIAEAAIPTGNLFEPVAAVYRAGAPMQRSGLTGPVLLRLAG